MAKFDVNAVLKGAATSGSPKKTKSKTPRIQVDRLAPSIAQWLAAKQKAKDAEAEMAQAEAEILPVATEKRKAECRSVGHFETSIVVNDQIQVTTQNKYSPIDPAQKPDIEKVFGDETDKLFKEKTEISLTERALNDPDILRKLIEAVGQERFGEYFAVKQVLAPTQVLHEGIVMDESVDKKAQKLVDAGVLRPYKPSLKSA
jgi:hypothetical protein